MKKDPRTFVVKIIFCIGLFIALLSLAVILLLTPPPKNRASLSPELGINAEGSHIGGDFELIDSDHNLVNSKSFRGKLMLIYFGFTYCPDICPASLLEISNMLDALGSSSDQVQSIFITIDPERDTPEDLKSFFKNYDSRILALTGSKDETSDVAKKFKVYYAVAQDGNENTKNYLVNHSSFYYLISKDGKLVKYYSPGTGGAAMAKDIKLYLSSTNH